jgi:D-beta-D-heptose 7-phosphate kinase/D-beta-D-heptose 1-phosphate adenosyltransferase
MSQPSRIGHPAPPTLVDLVRDLSGRRVTVVGDVMLDQFVIGRVDRISPEAPVPIVCFDREEFRLGGGANVTHNITALGSRAHLVGLVGEDSSADELRRRLAACGLDDRGLIVDPARPTTRKMRIVTSRNQQVARVDQERDEEPEGEVLDALIRQVTSAADASEVIVLSDYRKGVVSAPVIAAAAEASVRRGVPLLVDPKTPVAARYRGTTLITPNHHEAELMTQRRIRTPADARAAARALHEETGADVVITRGEQGMWIFEGRRATAVEAELPAVAREVADVTGAGDTVIAVLALALAAGAGLVDAARLANLAAGLVVARFGPATVSPDELVSAAAAGVPS